MLKKLGASLFNGPLSFLVPVIGQVKAARGWLTLLVVASAAAFLYWKFATVTSDRNQLDAFARQACATAGAPLDASIEQLPDGKGGTRQVSRKRGELCSLRLLELAAFEREALKATNGALAGAIDEHNRKSAADASAAARDAAAAKEAARRMEEADHAIEGDRVGHDWFDALNGLAGLRRKAD